ncbi:MAG: 3'-5' exonuclease, partial [Pseudomonadota bacterium]
EWVASDIFTRANRNNHAWRDYAILYRGNFQSRVFEKSLRERQIPYRVSGGTSFFERAEIKDVLAYLRLLVNPNDDAAFLRVVNTPRREIGAGTLEKLGQYARSRHSGLLNACHELGLAEVMQARPHARLNQFANWVTLLGDNAARGGDPLAIIRGLLDDIHYDAWLREVSSDLKSAENRWKNVLELLDWIEQLARDDDGVDRGLAEIVAHITLMDRLDNEEDESTDNAVNLLTLHAAKGLEFSHVYLVGLEENILPHRTSIDEDNIEEERRLAYVGITRAQRTLSLSFARQRFKFGEMVECAPSRFIDELPADDLLWLDGDKAEVDPEQQRQNTRDHLADLRSLLSP